MIDVGLGVTIVNVSDREPRVLTLKAHGSDLDALPHGSFEPRRDRTLERALRRWVSESARLDLGYVEQLYTFGDRARDPRESEGGPRAVSIAYLALMHDSAVPADGTTWRNWYAYLPWEDWRRSVPTDVAAIRTRLRAWVEREDDEAMRRRRSERASWYFGRDGDSWNHELVLERYELLYEAELVAEAYCDRGLRVPEDNVLGRSMAFDHRRMLATAIGRLRGKIAYRPVVFELLPASFTLLDLQRTVEALAGRRLHTANFRRLVDREGLVERTGVIRRATGGRPAEEYRFRREVVLERPAPGVRMAR
ncbi:MAG TPA: hypothetical protein VGZ00_09650 [Candidatus Baltobacteraceae bacterium]|jgi:hypothetical protein|nr:hypothetical protein [Candidatus Baltobacteraceae bacterium]